MTPEFTKALTLAVVGLGTVFAGLAVLATALALVGRLDAKWRAREEEARAQAIEKPPTIDDLTLVLIAAAVATVVRGRHRIRRVRRIGRSPWTRQGRAVLMGSHTVHKNR